MKSTAWRATERVAVAVVIALVTALGVLGMVNSFARVDAAVAPSFGALAWTVPFGIDIGIAAFTGLDLVLAHLGMRAGWLRAFPWLLVAATIYLNIADEHTAVGAVAHAVLPGLWIIAVEAGSHAIRIHTGITHGRTAERIDRVRWSRWILAPVATVKLWRRMVLWEVTDYTVALRRERDRVLARCELADRYGRFMWRWKAPRGQRVLYRLGELAPARAFTQPPPVPPVTDPAMPAHLTPDTRVPAGKPAGHSHTPVGDARPALQIAPSPHLNAVLDAVTRLHAEGTPISGSSLGRALGRDTSTGRRRMREFRTEIDAHMASLTQAQAG